MHPAAYHYLAPRIVAQAAPRILEIGSLDVNSTVQGLVLRALAPGAAWHGIDERAGPGVDVVASAADFRARTVFDLAISAETLEHAAQPQDVIACAWRALRAGGVLLVTAAAPERAPHGCDGGPVSPGEHYGAISADKLRDLLADWQDVEVQHNPSAGDVYAQAVKPG